MISKKTIERVLILLTIIVGSLVIGIMVFNKIRVLDYSPMNGDFQTYNMVRRLFNGQIPFRDFFPYLGLGPLYLNSIICILTGNGLFRMSLISTLIMSAISFVVILYTILRVFEIKKHISLLIPILFISLMHIVTSNSGIVYETTTFLKKILYPGNSIRTHRAVVLFLCVLIFRIIFKNIDFKKFRIKDFKYEYVIICGFILGIFGCWSNDYGIPIIFASIFLFIVLLFELKKEFFIKLLIFIASEIVSIFTIISIVTLGNFKNWVYYNFKGVANDQFWYFSPYYEKKLILWEFITDFRFKIMILAIVILIGILIAIWVNKDFRTKKNISIIFMLTVLVLSGYLYSRTNNNDGFNILQVFVFAYIIYLYIWILMCITNMLIKKIYKNIDNITTLIENTIFIMVYTTIVVLFILNYQKLRISYNTYVDKTNKVYINEIDRICKC